MKELRKIWEIYPKLFKAVYQDHAKIKGTGHDLSHPLMCAQYCLAIGEDEWTVVAAAAALCHNADHVLEFEKKSEKDQVSWEDVVEKLMSWFNTENFTLGHRQVMIEAIRDHPKKNQPNSHSALITLQDADRLTCSEPGNVMTAAQFWRECPAVDPIHFLDDSKATFRDPRSVLKNLTCRRDWITEGSDVCVRLPEAKRLMKIYVEIIDEYIAEVIATYRFLRLKPFPKPE